MGVGILAIVVGFGVGGLMVASPEALWWATQSWQYRNPDANEPSEIAYGLTRIGGALLIVAGLVFGGVSIADERDRVAAERATQEAERAEANFVPPPPEKRGTLPVVGYVADPVPRGTAVDVYYLAPARSVSGFVLRMSGSNRSKFPCTSVSTSTRGVEGRVDVTVDLIWAPQRLSDMDDADECRFDGRQHKVADGSLGVIDGPVEVVTNSSIAGEDGTQILAAAPNNVVPRLAVEPDTLRTRPTVSDRGVIPIVGYQIGRSTDGERYLEVSYLSPKDSNARAGDSSGLPTGGCEITLNVSGRGTGEVTVMLRLRWSNGSGNYDDADDEQCRIGSAWSSMMKSQRLDVPMGTTVLTDGPVVNRRGEVTAFAAPGNRVPALG